MRRKMSNIKEVANDNWLFCNVWVKKSADREIPPLESTDNAGNSVNLVFGIIRLPSGWDFSVCIGNRY